MAFSVSVRQRRLFASAVLGLLAVSSALAQVLPFSPAERAAIASFGPWPPPAKTDPTNPGSGRQVAIDFGERLFFDERLSTNGRIACASCHDPERHWTDGRARGMGRSLVDRNTPSLNNLVVQSRFGWEAVTDKLWVQSIRPIVDQRELAADATHIAKLVREAGDYACRYQKLYGRAPPASDEEVLAGVGRALAAFQEVLSSGRAPFDEFRDALLAGDERAASEYSVTAQRGLKVFLNKTNCVTCHVGPNFSSGERRDNGVVPGATFRVPSLRHLALTGPYMHDGRIATLGEVLRHYERVRVPDVKPLALDAQDRTDLMVFLQSLTNFRVPVWRPTFVGKPDCAL